VIKTRRSIRRFLKKAISDDILEKVLEAARIAPSGSNQQPWRFAIVRDEQKKKKIARACYEQDFVAQALVVIICCSIKCSSGYEPWHDDAGWRDTVISTDHLIRISAEVKKEEIKVRFVKPGVVEIEWPRRPQGEEIPVE